MAITFVAAGSAWNSITPGSSFTLNKPSGIVAGDFLIAVVSWFPGVSVAQMTVTPPSGWTDYKEVYFKPGDNYPHQISVLTKVATGSEPSSWTGSFSSSFNQPVDSVVVAYRGVQQILVSGTSTSGNGNSSVATATVNNTADTNTWRVIAAGCTGTAALDYDLTTNDAAMRAYSEIADVPNNNGEQCGVWDSNGGIPLGNTNKTVSRNGTTYDSCCTCIMLLQASSGTAASGVLGATLPSLGSGGAFTGYSAAFDGSMAASLSPVTFDGAGFGTPPAVTGTMAGSLSPAVASVAAATVPSGTMSATVMPSVALVGETRVFGIRVINVDAEPERTIIVQSRAVDD